MKAILASRNLTLIEKTNWRQAIELYQQHNIKLADCLIASQLAKGVILCTYDQDFKRLKEVASVTPDQVIKSF